MSKLLVCKDVKKIYRQGAEEFFALDGINLEINKGEFVAICGPSGSGKTTLLQLIGALDLPSSGQILLDNAELTKLSSEQRADLRLESIGFIYQSFNLIPVLSALENVELVLELKGLSAKVRREMAVEVLAKVGLEDYLDRRPNQLSGGQQQRVSVARAIVANPKIVLADEPTANLDSKNAASLITLMKNMNQDLGVTFVFSTHDARVMDSAGRLIRIEDGKILAE